MTMKLSLFLSCVALTTAGSAIAQERAAAGALETQMTWSTLNSLVQQANVRIDGVNSRVDQAVVCGKLGKIYAPGGDGADGQGCKIVEDARVTTLINTVNNLQNTVTNANVTNVGSCSKIGMVYAPAMAGADANGCVVPVTGKDCVMDQARACGAVGNCVRAARVWNGLKSASYVNSAIPTRWKDGDTYIWHYASTQNDYGGGQCADGTITYFTTGH